MEFVFKGIARPASAVAERIATLNHEARNDAMKYGSVVQRALHFLAGLWIQPLLGSTRQTNKIGHRLGRLVVK